MLPKLSQAETFDIVQTAVDEDDSKPTQTKWVTSSLNKSVKRPDESSLPTELLSEATKARPSLPQANQRISGIMVSRRLGDSKFATHYGKQVSGGTMQAEPKKVMSQLNERESLVNFQDTFSGAFTT